MLLVASFTYSTIAQAGLNIYGAPKSVITKTSYTQKDFAKTAAATCSSNATKCTLSVKVESNTCASTVSLTSSDTSKTLNTEQNATLFGIIVVKYNTNWMWTTGKDTGYTVKSCTTAAQTFACDADPGKTVQIISRMQYRKDDYKVTDTYIDDVTRKLYYKYATASKLTPDVMTHYCIQY